MVPGCSEPGEMISLLLAAALFGCFVFPAHTSDPLLLEYSDYYYDLYYGDYDNYDDSGMSVQF